MNCLFSHAAVEEGIVVGGVCTLLKLAAKVNVSRIPWLHKVKETNDIPKAPNTRSQHGAPHVGHKQSCLIIEHFSLHDVMPTYLDRS